MKHDDDDDVRTKCSSLIVLLSEHHPNTLDDRNDEVAINASVHATSAFHSYVYAARSSFSDGWLYFSIVANSGNAFCTRCMRRIFQPIALHVPLCLMSIFLSLEVRTLSWRIICRTSFQFSPYLLCLSIDHPESSFMFENMFIKRTPALLRLSDPAMPAPPRMHSNFVDPANLKTEGLLLVSVCLILSTLVVSMRIWTKTRLIRKVVLEDCKSTLLRSSSFEFCSLIW